MEKSNVNTYLVTFRPLGEFAFGTERNFKFEGLQVEGQISYFVNSLPIPEQTTILGALRYTILEKEGKLKSDFAYNEEEKGEIQKKIGSESFDFAKDSQDFGAIKSISPVFLVNQEKKFYVRNPLNNKIKKGQGIEVIRTGNSEENGQKEEALQTSYNRFCFPRENEYNAKARLAEGYINLEDGKIETDIFQSAVMTGNRKNNGNIDQKEGFFKREVHYLKKGFSFAVIVEAEENSLPSKTWVRMGQRGAAFLLQTESILKNDLEEQVKTRFQTDNSGETWYYVLSDMVMPKDNTYSGFCIIYKKSIRNLQTDYDKKRRGIQRSTVQYNLIQAGSVFYNTLPPIQVNQNQKNIGYNYIVEIKPKKEG